MSPHNWGRGDKRRLKASEFPPAVLALVNDAQGGRHCVACFRARLVTPLTEPIELDHKQPMSRGGDNHWSNLQWLCRGHNRARGNRQGMPSTLPPWARRQAKP